MQAVDDGFRIHSGRLDGAAQRQLVAEIVAILTEAPLYRPLMPRTGRPMSVRMSNCGPLGWFTDRDGGYRYVDRHPGTGRPWPPIPGILLDLWRSLTGYPADPEACLVNHYAPGARMGLHRDADEAARDAPVLSVSLGDTALFRLGGLRRRDPTRSVRLASGDVMLLAGAARDRHHGVDRILAGSSRLLDECGFGGGGRINLTLRRVTPPLRPRQDIQPRQDI